MIFMDSIKDFFATKAIQYGANALRKTSTDRSHPEKHKSRDAIRATEDAQGFKLNNDLVSSYVKSLKSGVVGEGFTLQYKSEDRELNKSVEKWLNFWSEAGNCSIREVSYRQELERNMVAEAAIRGGFIIRHHWDKRFKTLYKFELLSCDMIDRSKNDFTKGLFFGTQTTSTGKIDGFWLYVDQQRMNSKYVKMYRGSTPNISLYLDTWTDPQQYTNVTPLAPILNTLDKLSTYTDSEVKSAEQRAKKSIIIGTPTYDMMIKAQEEVVKQSKVTADRVEAQKLLTEMLQEFTPTGIHEGAIGVLPGSEVWDLKGDGDTIYADINENSKQILSKALGLSPSTVAGLPESSYNVALKNTQSDEREYAIMGQMVIEKILKFIYRSAIEAGYLLNKYEMPNYYTMEDENSYGQSLKITRKKVGHIDPLKQAMGDDARVNAGFTSVSQVIADSGRDEDDVIQDEVRYETKRKQAMEDAGLTYVQRNQDKIVLEETKQKVIEKDLEGEE